MGYDAPVGYIEELPATGAGSQLSRFHRRSDCPLIKDVTQMRAVERPYSAARCRVCAEQAT